MPNVVSQNMGHYPTLCEHPIGTSWSEHHLKRNSSSCCFLGKTHQLETVETTRLEGHPPPRGDGSKCGWTPPGRQGAARREGAEEWLHFHFCLVFRLLVERQVGLEKKKKIQCKLLFSINQCIFFFSCLASLHLFVFPSPTEQGDLIFLNLA